MTSSGFAVSKRPATVQAFPRTTTLYSITSSYYRGQFIALSRRPHSQLKARVFAECRIITAPSSRRLLLHASMDSTDLQPSFMQVKESVLITILLFAVLFGALLLLDLVLLLKFSHPLMKVSHTGGFHIHHVIGSSFTCPFLLSAAMTILLGCICVPFLKEIKAHQIFRTEGPSSHFSKMGTPTMGGLFFIPVGLIVSGFITHFFSLELYGLITATLAFGAIGLLDDVLVMVKKCNYGLPGWCKLWLQVCVGIWFYLWLESASLQTSLQLNTVVLLPLPFHHWNLGKWYLPLTAFCFASMSNGVNLTDGLDGLGAGTAAAAFVGMAFAVLHVNPAVGIFGVSMAGACVGFLVHNHHKAAVFMGDTGSLALGGALAAMAAYTGMFLPLFIVSGVFFLETVSVMLQVFYFKITKKVKGVGQRLFKMAPLHHHLELTGVREPTIVAGAYVMACFLALVGGYLGCKMPGKSEGIIC